MIDNEGLAEVLRLLAAQGYDVVKATVEEDFLGEPFSIVDVTIRLWSKEKKDEGK